MCKDHLTKAAAAINEAAVLLEQHFANYAGSLAGKELTEVAQDFIAARIVDDRIKDATTHLKSVVDVQKERLTELFGESEVTSISLQGRTVFIHRTVFAGPKEGNKDALIGALNEIGRSDLIKSSIHFQSLVSLCKEYENSHGTFELPPALDAVVKVGEKYDIRIKKKK